MASALSDAEFASAFNALGPFEAYPHFAVAVSGGADSLSLVLLAQRFAIACGARLTALTVDHALRAGSSEEARQVGAWLAGHGIAHEILTWRHDRIKTNVQEHARNARYTLMGEWCRRHNVLWLLTAHHADDQCETLLLRQQRGSTRFGLSGIDPASFLHGVHVLRPLLCFSKQRLQTTLEAAGQMWLEDPSNKQPVFARNLVRQQLISDSALQRQGALLKAGRRSNAIYRRCTEQQMASAMAAHVQIFPEGFLHFSPGLLTTKRDMLLRILAYMLETISGQSVPPRLATLEAVLQCLQHGKRTTAHGCVFWPRLARGSPHILLFRELSACKTALAESQMRWDGRFNVHCSGPLQGLSIRPIGMKSTVRMPSHLRGLPKALIATFPSLWMLETLLIAPHIGYRAPEAGSLRMEVDFCPLKPLGKPAFCVIDEDTDTRKVG